MRTSSSSPASIRAMHVGLGLYLLEALACGGGTPVNPADITPGTITVVVFAGAPVAGAHVQVLAVDSDDGHVLTNRPNNGVVGGGGPTDATGTAAVKLDLAFTGTLKVLATGGTYTDPTDGTTTIPVPTSLDLCTYVRKYKAGTDAAVPVTLATTLASAEALAYAQGLNPYWPHQQSLTNALVVTDPLFVQHVAKPGTWAIRTMAPVPFTGPQPLRDAVYAGLFDLALNQLARKIGNGATAPGLAGDLVMDLSADGQFDGLAGPGHPLSAAGYQYTAETTRGDLAHALDAFSKSDANKTGLTRDAFKSAGVYDAMALDGSILYPASSPVPPFSLDPKPGTVTVAVWTGGPVKGAQIQVLAIDPATGAPITSREDGGVLGTGGPTDSAGRAVVDLTGVHFGSIIQVVATGGRYTDPTDGLTSYTLPTPLRLSSYRTGYVNGDSMSVPITFWTTIADAAALAYAQGRNATSTTPTALDKALAQTDLLLTEHWDKEAKWAFRSSNPGTLVSPLTGPAWAALPELALNQLAVTIATGAKLVPRKDFTPPTLVLDLLADLSADGQFDGRGASGQLATPGSPAYAYSAETTRGQLAHALDDYIQSPTNTSGVSRTDLLQASVYDSAALDVSILYPESVKPPPFTLDDKPGTITVAVWAGGAVKGAQIQVLAIDPTTGLAQTSRPDVGVLGTAAATDDAGRAPVKLQSTFTGIIQVVAIGGTYVDPTDGQTAIAVPATLRLSSYIASYNNGVNLTVPVGFWTTIADGAALAYALGRNPTSTAPMPLDQALVVVDQMATEHFDAKAGTWKLRKSVPGSLALPLTASAWAALPELALNELARQLAAKGKLEIGKTFSATDLVADLLADLAAGGQYDGKGGGGAQIATPGTPPYLFGTETTRADLARAMDGYIQSAINTSGVARADLQAASIYDAIAMDSSALYPSSVPPPPFSLETEAPSLTLVDLAGLGAVPPGQTVWTKDTKITVTVTAKDNSGTGVQGVYARVESGVVQPATLSADGKWTASLDLLADGQNFVYVWGVDNVGNSGKGLAPPYQLAPKIGRDTTPPNLQLVDALSYTSEQGILLTSDAVPPQYKLAGARIAVRPDSPVYKAASRVSFGATAPTPADLEGANSNNVPYLKFSVGFRSGSDAPLVQPTYTIHIASGLTTQPPGGALIGDASPTTDTAYFYLPLAQETLFPGGAEAASSMTFTVTVTSADQVGNSTTTTFPTTGGVYTYNFVAPPLYITDSTAAYAAAAVPGSIYPLKITDVNYSKIFDGSDLRYTRLVLANPSAVPLQVAVSTVVGACGATETWNYATAQLPTTSSYAYGAHSYKGVYDWSICVYDSKTKYDCLGTATHPDGWYPCNSDFMDLGNSGIPLQYPYIGHDQWAGWALEFGCATLTDIYSYFRSGTDTNKAPVNLVLSNPLYAYSDSFLNQENQELPAVATVPAASNGQPGRISLYLKGSNKNLRTSELQWTTPSSFWPDVTFPKTVGMYPKFLMDYWDPITRGTAGDFYLKSQASRNYEYLNNSALSCSGTFSFTTDANSAFRALPAPQLSTVSTATKTYAY